MNIIFAKLREDNTLDILEYVPGVVNPTFKIIKNYASEHNYKIVEYNTQPYEYSYYKFKEYEHKIVQLWFDAEYSQIESDCLIKTQQLLDSEVQKHGYDNIQSLVSYIGDPNKTFDKEAKAGKIWRSDVWTTLFEILNKLKNGEIFAPKNWSEIEKQLPKISWP